MAGSLGTVSSMQLYRQDNVCWILPNWAAAASVRALRLRLRLRPC